MEIDKFNLYIVRHGETEANVDRSLYITKADHAIRLTPKGIQQAKDAGRFLAHFLQEQQKATPNFGNIRLWHSPYYRGRETAFHMLGPLGRAFSSTKGQLSYHEDPFLFEQKIGLSDGLTDEEYRLTQPEAAADFQKHVLFNGRTYAGSLLGESRIDLMMRLKHCFSSIAKDRRQQDIRHVIFVNHGVTSRAMMMSWMHYSPEWLDAEKNPGNCWIRHIHGDNKKGYVDEGYIFGEEAPLHDPQKTQKQLEKAEDIYMLKPGRPNIIVPPGIPLQDPFAEPRPS